MIRFCKITVEQVCQLVIYLAKVVAKIFTSKTS